MNRWNEIYAQLDLPQTRAVQRLSRLAAMVALLLLGLTVTGLTAYAVYQLTQEDEGLIAIEEAGLATEINQALTIDGITLTVDKAFVDSSRMILWLSISGSEHSGSLLTSFMEPKISYSDGRAFGQNGGLSISYEKVGDVLYYLVTLYHEEPILSDGILPIRLDFLRTDYKTFDFPDDLDTMTQEQIDMANSHEHDTHVQMPEGFRFDFELPVFAPIRLEPKQTIESAGIKMTLQEVLLSSSTTYVVLCHDNSLGHEWELIAKIRINEVETNLGSWGIMGDKDAFSKPTLCWQITFLIPYLEKGGTLELNAGFIADLPEGISEIPESGREWLATMGIEGAISRGDGGWGLEIVRKPDDMDEATAYKLIFDALRPTHEAKWIFQLELPE